MRDPQLFIMGAGNLGRNALHRIGDVASSDLVTVAGQKLMGKTSFLCTVAIDAAIQGVPVQFYSLSQNQTTLEKLLVLNLYHGSIERRWDDFTVTEEQRQALKDLPITIHDQAEIDIDYIDKTASGLTIIDTINHLEDFSSTRPRTEELACISRRLTRVARRLDHPVFVSAFLSKYPTSAALQRVTREASIKENSYIGDVSNVLLNLHREEIVAIMEKPKDNDLPAMCEWQMRVERTHREVKIETLAPDIHAQAEFYFEHPTFIRKPIQKRFPHDE